MPRVNVEEKAFSDPRFDILAQLLGTDRYGAIGRMVYVWRWCTDRMSHALSPDVIGGILGHQDGAELLVRAELAQRLNDRLYRIRGTEGRIEWMKRLRKAAQKGGLAKAKKTRG